MASSGTKRPFIDDSDNRSNGARSDDGGKRSKPRDWRDAFLEEDEPRRRRSRSRSRDRDWKGDSGHKREYQDRDRERRSEYRERGGLDYHDRDRERERPRDSGRDRDRDRDRERRDRDRGQGHYDREQRERGDSRRYGDTRDQRRDRDDRERDRDRPRDGDSSRRRSVQEREEGEIEPSPEKKSVALPSASPARSQTSPRADSANGRNGPPPRGFQAISIPTGPRSRAPTRPSHLASDSINALDRDKNGSASNEASDEPIVVLEEEKDPEQLLEERRKKREAIMAKFKAQGRKEQPVKAEPGSSAEPLGTGADSATSAGTKTGANTATGATPLLKQLGTRSTSLFPAGTAAGTPVNAHEPSLAPTPLGHDFDLTKEADSTGEAVIPAETKDEAVAADMMISAADYDPSKEGMVDREKRMKDMESGKVVAQEVAEGVGEPIVVDQPEEEWEEVEIEVEDEEDEVDMFEVFGGEEKEKKTKKVTVRRLKGGIAGENKQQVVNKPKAKVASALAVVDNVDDTDGYYRITPGEILDDGRYEVTINLGKGMFSGVVKAKVLKAVDQERRQDVVGKEVAIKVIRSQESMYVAGRKEAGILKKLNDADPEDKKHIVRMDRTFEHRGHLCIVTESLSMNLRDVIKRFGKDVGLNMRAVRAYAHQMFLALSLMRKCGIVHADIKPDNILVSENKATLKVCDLGSASDVTEGEITPYLVSRFYRAPEIILGLPYDTAIDIWSVGCTLYELYTGKILFPGRSNNHMLLLMMEVKGKFNHRLIKKATLGEMHFDESMNFVSIEKDKITLQDVAKTLVINKPTRDLRSRLLPPSNVQVKMKEDELKQLLNFVDLLDKCLQLDPARRLTPRDALMHPFLTA